METKKESQNAHEAKIARERLGKPLDRHPFLGLPKPLSPGKIPTFGDIAQAFLAKQSEIRLVKNLKQNPPVWDVINTICEELVTIVQNLDNAEGKEVLRIQHLRTQVNKILPIISHIRKARKLPKGKENMLSKFVKVYKISKVAQEPEFVCNSSPAEPELVRADSSFSGIKIELKEKKT